MATKWLIIGISGVTCAGKTTLSKEILKILTNVKLISQDDYFLPQDSPKHVYIPELNHFNWEILSSMDMDKMYNDIKSLTSNNYIERKFKDVFKEAPINGAKKSNGISEEKMSFIRKILEENNINILLIEGFSIFNYAPIEELCHLKFYLKLPYEICFERRRNRVYDPPDVPGYFEKCVWPEHIRQLEEIRKNCKNIVYLTQNDGDKRSIILKKMLEFLYNFARK